MIIAVGSELTPSFRQKRLRFKVENLTASVRVKRLRLLEIRLVGCSIIERLMKPLLIVKVEIVSQSTPSRGNRVIVVEIDLLIFRLRRECSERHLILRHKHSMKMLSK